MCFMFEKVSNCCDAPPIWESDICAKCKEHAEFIDIDDISALLDS